MKRNNLIQNSLLLVFIMSCFLTACEKDPIAPTPSIKNHVDLRAPIIGQRSMYLKYTSDCKQDSFRFTGDTLFLDVIDQAGSLNLEESYSEGSPSYSPQNPIYSYPLESIKDAALLPDRSSSNLFFFYANDTIHLNPLHSTHLIQDSCTLIQNGDPFIGNDIGFLSSFNFGSIVMKDVTSVSCEPFWELDAYLLYDEGKIKASHVVSFESGLILPPFVSEAYVTGWVLIE